MSIIIRAIIIALCAVLYVSTAYGAQKVRKRILAVAARRVISQL
jgi:hypothetical protein